METLTLATLKTRAAESPLKARTQAQITAKVEKQTKSGKPYLNLQLSDSAQTIEIKIWQDTKAFRQAESFKVGSFVLAEASWTENDYGINADGLDISGLDPKFIEELLEGDPELAKFQSEQWQTIQDSINSISDPRLRLICQLFIETFGDQFRRTAAARNYHHARRGGLVEHVGQMMRSAEQVCIAYSELNRDLLIAGVLFHDCGKLWENSYPAESFEMPYHLAGELLGHIPIGIELVNHLWKQLEDSNERFSQDLKPSNTDVKLHLQHLVASHHGMHEFGSPTLPKTPEATALHYIDNLDAKLEMFREGYRDSPKLTDKIQERHWPLPAKLVRPLEPFQDKN